MRTFSRNDLNAVFRRLGYHAFFIQIGAMDGKTFDPIHTFVQQQKWRGLLVEPVPDMFEKLKFNYTGYSGLHFARTAIAMRNGMIRMKRIDPVTVKRGILPHGALGISTIMPARGILGDKLLRFDDETVRRIRKHTRTLSVPCCTLSELLYRHRVRNVDLLVIDAEGADWMIAKQFPLGRHRPKVIYLEYDHLPNRERSKCLLHFRRAGYKIRLDEFRNENLLAERF